jgi:hypothetical protein
VVLLRGSASELAVDGLAARMLATAYSEADTELTLE